MVFAVAALVGCAFIEAICDVSFSTALINKLSVCGDGTDTAGAPAGATGFLRGGAVIGCMGALGATAMTGSPM